jgi:hypothetical protein
MRGFTLCVLTCLACVTSSRPADASLSIPWWTIDGGGTTEVVGASLRLSGTIGQPDAGSASSGSLVLAGGFWMGGTLPMDVDEETVTPTTALELFISPCVPNPFRWSTSWTIDLPEARPVEARIHDAMGREMRRITVGTLPAGHHSISWDGTDEHDRRVPSGIYLLRIRAGEVAEKRTLVLIR